LLQSPAPPTIRSWPFSFLTQPTIVSPLLETAQAVVAAAATQTTTATPTTRLRIPCLLDLVASPQ
jgi:hypothetical protein